MSTLDKRVRMNSNEVYFAEGEKAGRAMKQKDIGLFNFQREWFRRALLVASEGEVVEAREFWGNGYKQGRGL